MDNHTSKLSRRAFSGAALAALVVAPGAFAAPALTAWSPLGPFYPIRRLAENDWDLTRLKGHKNRAKGEVIEVTGRVLDRYGKPIRGATLELWQCNAAGRYAHANEQSTRPLDPDFQGYASVTTARDGEWRIRTIKPASYASPIGQRSPHIHFDIRGRDERLIAQMYFPEEASANANDQLYKELGNDAPTSIAGAVGAGRYRWDIVLMDG